MTTDNTFVEHAAAFINLANEQALAADVDQVAGSMLLAAARYCAHVSAGNALSADAMREERQAQIDFVMQNFRRLLEGEYDFYIEKFDDLILGAKAD
ncbi:MAG TPA: DUF3144 domain-containing protein [Asticcacaulis sp.]|nr:DUF3144 domain-containing protein [Asticcacaulis sp.]